MARRLRRNRGAAIKAKLALEAFFIWKTLNKLAQQFEIYPN
jgi:hypothetical protein